MSGVGIPADGFNQDIAFQTGNNQFNRTTSLLKGMGGFSDSNSNKNMGAADTTASFYEKEKKALEKIK